jgi:hypothetical protein
MFFIEVYVEVMIRRSSAVASIVDEGISFLFD